MASLRIASGFPTLEAGRPYSSPVRRSGSRQDEARHEERVDRARGFRPLSLPSPVERGSRSARQPVAGRGTDEIFPLLYAELERIARRHLAHQQTGHPLETTDLVHEAYLRLVDRSRVAWKDQDHFYAASSRAMRHVLVDDARRRRAAKRGGERHPVELSEGMTVVEQRPETLVALDEALGRLKELDARQGWVVEYRFFGGLSEEDTARRLGITARTVRRDWTKAKGWLYLELMT